MGRIPLVLAAALAAAGCAGPPPPQTTPDLEPGTFTLGYAAVSEHDRELVRAAQLAVDEINADGGVEGAVRLELVVDDEGGEPGEVARRLVLRGIQALVLACDPDAERAQADVADRTQVLAFAPCNEDPTIAARYPVVWPVSLGANAEAAALADHALTRRYEAFRVLGSWEPMTRYLRAAAAERAIALADHADAPTLGTHRVEGENVPDGTAYTTYGYPSPGSAAAEFYAAFAGRYGEPPRVSAVALGYDAVRVVAAAIRAAGGTDAAQIGERLAGGLTVEGALGEIVYPGAGDHQPETAVAVVTVQGGRRVLTEKALPENIPPP